MLSIALVLLPDFLLIFLGLGLRTHGGYPPVFWQHIERLVYYVMFPALLFRAVSHTPLAFAPAFNMLLVGVGFTLAGLLFGLAANWLFQLTPLTFASSIQTAFRFNTYVGLAVIDRLAGQAGVATFAMLLGVIVPLVNGLAVWFLARQGDASLWRELLRNPMILSTLSGFAFNLTGLPMPEVIDHVVGLLAAAALPLGLISVGAGLRAQGLRASLPLVNYFTAVKLVAVPAVAWGLSAWLGVTGLYFQAALVLAALPTASSAYILAMRMGGDGKTVATIITMNIFVAMLTLPMWLGWGR